MVRTLLRFGWQQPVPLTLEAEANVRVKEALGLDDGVIVLERILGKGSDSASDLTKDDLIGDNNDD